MTSRQRDDRAPPAPPSADPASPWPDASPVDDARIRRILALTIVGALANLAWLVHALGGGDVLGAALSGIGVILCAVPVVLCARRLARVRRRDARP